MSNQSTSGYTDLCDLGIKEFNLSVAVYNGLKRDGVNTLGDLLGRSAAHLESLQGIGPRGADEVQDMLNLVNQFCGTQLELALNSLPAGHLVDFVDSIPER